MQKSTRDDGTALVLALAEPISAAAGLTVPPTRHSVRCIEPAIYVPPLPFAAGPPWYRTRSAKVLREVTSKLANVTLPTTQIIGWYYFGNGSCAGIIF